MCPQLPLFANQLYTTVKDVSAKKPSTVLDSGKGRLATLAETVQHLLKQPHGSKLLESAFFTSTIAIGGRLEGGKRFIAYVDSTVDNLPLGVDGDEEKSLRGYVLDALRSKYSGNSSVCPFSSRDLQLAQKISIGVYNQLHGSGMGGRILEGEGLENSRCGSQVPLKDFSNNPLVRLALGGVADQYVERLLQEDLVSQDTKLSVGREGIATSEHFFYFVGLQPIQWESRRDPHGLRHMFPIRRIPSTYFSTKACFIE